MATGGGGGGEGDPGGADGGRRGGKCDAGGGGWECGSSGLSPGRIDLVTDGDEPSPLALVPPSPPRICALESAAGNSSVDDHLSHYVSDDE